MARIHRGPACVDRAHQFYVAADFRLPPYHDKSQVQYLHQDGKWRLSTCMSDEQFTGYFDSRKEARAALSSAGGTREWLNC